MGHLSAKPVSTRDPGVSAEDGVGAAGRAGVAPRCHRGTVCHVGCDDASVVQSASAGADAFEGGEARQDLLVQGGW